MRRKPSASHCVKKPPPEVYRPDSWVFFSGAQVLRISSVNGVPRRQVVDHEQAVLVAERHRLAVDQQRVSVQLLAVQAQRLRPARAALRSMLHPVDDQRLGRVEVEGQVDACGSRTAARA